MTRGERESTVELSGEGRLHLNPPTTPDTNAMSGCLTNILVIPPSARNGRFSIDEDGGQRHAQDVPQSPPAYRAQRADACRLDSCRRDQQAVRRHLGRRHDRASSWHGHRRAVLHVWSPARHVCISFSVVWRVGSETSPRIIRKLHRVLQPP